MLSFIKRPLGSTSQRTRKKSAFRLPLYTLERRAVPSITLINSTTLLARGDDGGVIHNDTFQLHTRTDNGQFQIVQSVGTSHIASKDVPTGVTQIVILGDGGTDKVLV